MELRHLRYFVAVAEEGSLTVAAGKRLHTAQPSLSRQIRDLEREVGVQLLNRTSQGTELTAAGRAFLDHARLSLAQADAAAEAARRMVQPARPVFAMGFLTGQEVDWLPHAPGILRDELPDIEIRMSSGFSTDLADELQKGKLDVAFLRREPKPDLDYRLVAKEPLIAVLPADHPLAASNAIDPSRLADQTLHRNFESRAGAARGDLRLPEACGPEADATLRDRQLHDGGVDRDTHARRRSAAGLSAELSAGRFDQPHARGRTADHRSAARLSQGEPLRDADEVSVEDR